VEYPPPIDADGNLLPQSNFNDAKRDGYTYPGMISDRDLRSRYRPFRTYYPNYVSRNYGISYGKSGRSSNENRAFYYEWTGPASTSLWDRRNQNSNYSRHDIWSTDEKNNFANWYTYYNTRSKLARAAVSHAFVNFGPDFKVDWQQINHVRFRDKNSNMKTFDGSHRQDFYDWLFNVPGTGNTPLRRATYDTGRYFRDDFSGVSAYYDDNFGAELTCQQNFHIAISDGSWNSSSGISGNKDNTSISLPNLPDGANVSYDPSNWFYHDSNSSTLADTAFYFWSHDLKPGLDNNVPTFIDDYTDSDGNIVSVPTGIKWWNEPELMWNPKNDPANWQHMVNFNVGLGIEGSFNRDTDLPGLRSGAFQWASTNNDTCFKRDSNGDEVTRSCANHICYDGSDLQVANFVPCDGDMVADGGDIVRCRNGDNNSNIDCDDRIVRRVNRSQGRVDDVWHASLNSRGDYFSAKNPQELSSALYQVVSNIIKRKGRASAGSVSSSIISDSTLSYRTGYDTSNWTGFVVATSLDEQGNNDTVLWDAACKLTGGFCSSVGATVAATNDHSSRNIFTFNKESGSQHPFHTVEMTSLEESMIMNSDFITDSSALGVDYVLDDIIHFIRGDRNYEINNGGQFRSRQNLLGDVIHSPAKIVRGPSASYEDDKWDDETPEGIQASNDNGYAEFKQSLLTRKAIVLVGANDGMLHAFDAGLDSTSPTTGGDELWAYIPTKSLDGISELANPQYKHQSFVDATPIIKDAMIDNVWGTYAVGGVRKGGKEFYALKMAENLADEPEVLWEFTDDEDEDLGYTYSGAVITRVVNTSNKLDSKWIALLPNGYNSTNHESVLYALDLKTGQVLSKWKTNIGDINNPNGLGPVVAGDWYSLPNTNGDVDKKADLSSDFAYAGDLAGNVYKFNLQDIFSGTVNSTGHILYNGSYSRPITTSPRVLAADDGGNLLNVRVIFGTGKYIEPLDKAITSTHQYFFGIVDNEEIVPSHVYTLNDSSFVIQSISSPNSTDRNLTRNVVSPSESWKIRMPDNGERLINSIQKSGNEGNIAVVTIIPNGTDPCLAGGSSWIMVLDAKTGGSPSEGSLFDSASGGGSTTDAVLIDDIVLGLNTLTPIGGANTIINVDTTGDNGVVINTNKASRWSRRSWHRIIFE
jgi:type IV pilus assembly protein PilY1